MIKNKIQYGIKISNKEFSVLIALKSIVLYLPILITGIQSVVIAKIASEMTTSYNPVLLLLVIVLFSQMPTSLLARKLTSFETQNALFIPFVIISLQAPLLNLGVILMFQYDLLDIASIVFKVIVFLINVFSLAAFAGIIYVNRKKMYSIYRTLLITISLASISQLFLFSTILIEVPVDYKFFRPSSFTGNEITIFVLNISWFALMSVFLSIFIRIKTRRINIFNSVSRYDLWTLNVGSIGVLIFGWSMKSYYSTSAHDKIPFFTFSNSSFVLMVISMIILLAMVVYICFMAIKKHISDGSLRFMVMVASVLNLIFCAILFYVSKDKDSLGMGLIFSGSVGLVSHFIFSNLTRMSHRPKDSAFIFELGFSFAVIMIGVVVILNILRVDSELARVMFSPELLFVFFELCTLLVIIFLDLRVKMHSVIKMGEYENQKR